MAAELFIYDVIDPIWGVSAAEIVNQLRDIKGDVTVRINSPGGDAFEGVTLYNALKRHAERGKVTVEVDGLAASAASIIAMAGDEIIVAKGAMLMIHCAWSFTIGDAGEHEKRAAMLAKLDTQIAGVYAARSKKSEAECHELMKEETWMGAEEALDLGFCDSIGAAKAPPEKSESRAAAKFMSAFRRLPEPFKAAAAARATLTPQPQPAPTASPALPTPMQQRPTNPFEPAHRAAALRTQTQEKPITMSAHHLTPELKQLAKALGRSEKDLADSLNHWEQNQGEISPVEMIKMNRTAARASRGVDNGPVLPDNPYRVRAGY